MAGYGDSDVARQDRRGGAPPSGTPRGVGATAVTPSRQRPVVHVGIRRCWRRVGGGERIIDWLATPQT